MAGLPWRDFSARVLALYAPPQRSRRTRSKMASTLRIAARAGARRSTDLTTEFLAHVVAARSSAACANTVRGDLSYLSAAAGIAVEEGWLDRPPRLRRIRPRPSPPARKTLHSVEDVARVLELLRSRAATWEGQRLHAVAATVAYTGLRSGEALNLMVADVDLKAGVLAVVDRGPLKTEASAAPVPIAPELAEVLAEWIPRTGSPWLFPGVRLRGPWTGGLTRSRATTRLRLAGEELGISGLTLHSLRHTFATWARRRWGLSALQLRDVLRHTTIETQEHYVHAESDLGRLVASVEGVSYPRPAGAQNSGPNRACRGHYSNASPMGGITSSCE